MHAGFYYYFQSRDTSFVPMKNYAYLIGAMILPLVFQSVLLFFDSRQKSALKEIALTLVTYLFGTGVYCLSQHIGLPGAVVFDVCGFAVSLWLATWVKADAALLKAVTNITTFLSHAVLGLFFLPLFLLVAPVTVAAKLFSGRKAVAAGLMVIVGVVM